MLGILLQLIGVLFVHIWQHLPIKHVGVFAAEVAYGQGFYDIIWNGKVANNQ